MKIDLSKKRALVLGASKGIGRAIAVAFAECGASVTLLARSEQKLFEVMATLDNDKGQIHDILIVDISEDTFMNTVKNYVENNGSFHIVVNNTGGPKAASIRESVSEEFVQAFHDHVLVSHELMKYLSKFMIESSFGRIINIISTSVKQPVPGLGVSNVIRGAMASWSKTLANELAPYGITVNNILPGATLTERNEEVIAERHVRTGKSVEELRQEGIREIPMGRFADPSEIANVAAFLASPLASYITGTSILVDGGRTKGLS